MAHALDSGATLPQALNQQAPAAIQFVPPDDLPAGAAYEQHIFDTGRCPTRESLHDFFNGLAWLVLPLSKRQLNQVHVAQIAANGIGRAARAGARRGNAVRRERRRAERP